jgi:hypothetical protein
MNRNGRTLTIRPLLPEPATPANVSALSLKPASGHSSDLPP